VTYIKATKYIPVGADELWRDIGSFQAVGDWHPMLASVEGEGEQPGAQRVARTNDGQRQVERLREISQEGRFYRYVMESTPLPVTGYVGEFRVEPAGDAASTVVWASDFKDTSGDADGTSSMINGFLTAGLAALGDRYS
jgi:hypothetical protein